jgi:dihydropyrimidinase
MVVDFIIKNGKLVIPKVGIINAGVAVENGKIVGISKNSHLPEADKTINAEGNFILPGIIEPHSHLGNYAPFMDDLKTETASAAGGGVTTLCSYLKILKMPEPYCKAESHLQIFEDIKKIVEQNVVTDFVFHLLMTSSRQIEDINKSVRHGISSFKYIMGFTGEEAKQLGIASLPDGDIYRGFVETSKHRDKNAVICIHTENVDIINIFRKSLVEKGRKDLAAWTDSRPDFNEVDSFYKVAFFAEQTKCPLYIVHVDNGLTLGLIKEAKQKGLTVYSETCPHYLAFTKNDDFGILGKIAPPLRDKNNIQSIWNGIQNGTIDTIGTDHMGGILKKDKLGKGDVWSALSGFPGVETMLPFMLSEGVNKGRISLERLSEICSYNTAKIFGLHPRKGTISIGSDADLTIIDLHKKIKVSPEVLHTASDFTLFDGWSFEGWPILTMVRGNIVMENGDIVGKPGTGKYLMR